MAYRSVNPYNGEILKSFDDLTEAEAENALATADHVYRTDWKKRTIAERSAILSRAAAILFGDVDRFAMPLTLEMGKLLPEARDEVRIIANILRYYASQGEKMLAPKTIDVSDGEAIVVNEPIGIVFGVEPWNFPYYQLIRVVAPNLVAGNVVMIKHASNVPQSAEAIETLFREAGAPQGVYTNLFVTKDQIAWMIADPRVRGVALTGSEGAGSVVAGEAGKALKKSTLELGGSDAFIVLEDADLDRAVAWGVWGKLNNTGQSCVAAKRFIVLEEVADEYLRRFRSALSKLKPGDPLEPGTTLAPLCSEEALSGLLRQIDTAVSHGATLLAGGKRIDRPGSFIEPGILTDLTPDNPAFHQEFFGPIALFFKVKSEQEAIALANDSPFGLGGSVFTKDIERGKRIARQIESGMVFVNKVTWSHPELPFGGVKNSGYGRELSDLGVMEFVNKKLIRVSTEMPPAEFPTA